MATDPMKREVRFCFCGWSIFGTKIERINAMADHLASDEHKKRIEGAASNIDHLVESDIERRLDA